MDSSLTANFPINPHIIMAVFSAGLPTSIGCRFKVILPIADDYFGRSSEGFCCFIL